MSEPIVSVESGKLRGLSIDGVWSFRGIPYARPPVASLRFRAPQPADSWAGVRDATSPALIAPQLQSGLGTYFPGDPVDQAEDCLSLNVWTAEPFTAARPVLVFIHGGAFLSGSGSGVLYDGASLAKRDVVVVTMNYRLGALGFLSHRALRDADGGCGNWGQLDQLAALRWVRTNIAAFGGDPSRVTVFGESAGAMSIANLLGTRRSAGLFRRAILQSGATHVATLDAASATAEQLAHELAISKIDRDVLCDVPVNDLIDAQQAVSAAIDAGVGLPFPPVVDGGLFERHPADVIANGGSSGIDVLLGTNRDEFRFFTFALEGASSLSLDDATERVRGYLRGANLPRERVTAAELIDCYEKARAARSEQIDPRSLFEAIATDWIFRIPQLRLADARSASGASTYAYRFDWTSPFAGGALGACHGLELPFVFGALHNPVVAFFSGGGPDAMALSDRMQSAWIAFATTGSPQCSSVGDWPSYDQADRSTMIFGQETGLHRAPGETERELWDAVLGRYGVDGPVEGAKPATVALAIANTT